MKRLLAVFIALSVAAPVPASVLVVRARVSAGAGSYYAPQEFQIVQQLLDERGATWRDVSMNGVTTTNAKAGNLVIGNATYHHDALVFLSADINTAGTQGGCNWCAMTLTANWPSVPTLIINGSSHNSGQWTQAVNCSTGVTGWAAPRVDGYNMYSAYKVGTPYAWHTWGQLDPVSLVANSAGTFRVVVSASGNQSSRRLGGASTNYNTDCTDCDSLVSFAKHDSLALVWVRYRTGAPLTPLIFVAAGAPPNVGLIKMGLAMLDSVTAGAVFDNPALRTKTRGVAVLGGFSRCRMDSLGVTIGKSRGIDPSDTTNVSAGIDSLNRLGIPFTFFVDPDSASTYPSDLRRMKRAGKAHFALEMYGGSVVGLGVNASRSNLLDPFGHIRARTMIPRGAVALPANCTASDSSAFCLIKSGLDYLETNAPGRVDHSIYPAFGDYTPFGDTKAAWKQTSDSLNAVLAALGVKVVVMNPNMAQGNVGRGFATTGASSVVYTSGQDPWGFDPGSRFEAASTFPGSGIRAGAVAYLSVRQEFDGNPTSFKGVHVIDAEWSRGELGGDSWYPDWPTLSVSPALTQPLYHHDFFTRTPIIAFPMQHLGASADGKVHRQAWWAVKWTEMQMRATNSLMIPGRTLDEWDYVENLTP